MKQSLLTDLTEGIYHPPVPSNLFNFIREPTMPTIENVSRFCIQNGNHKTGYENTLLISINDPGLDVPKNWDKFTWCFDYYFLDAEKPIEGDHDGEFLIKESDAEEIAYLIRMCFEKNINILVHCSAGICRSGAVAECAEAFGFEYIGNHKQPNLLVKRLVMKYLMSSEQSYDEVFREV